MRTVLKDKARRSQSNPFASFETRCSKIRGLVEPDKIIAFDVSEINVTFIKQPLPRECYVCFQNSCIQFTPSSEPVCIMNIIQTKREHYINYQVTADYFPFSLEWNPRMRIFLSRMALHHELKAIHRHDNHAMSWNEHGVSFS